MAMMMGGSNGLDSIRSRGRYYDTLHSYDSYPDGWPIDLVATIPRRRDEYEKWLAETREIFTPYEDLFKDFLTVTRLHPEPGLDEAPFQVSCASLPPPPDDHQFTKSTKDNIHHAPSYIPKLIDTVIKGVYCIDIDNEVFTVDNKAHFKLDRISHINWTAALKERDTGFGFQDGSGGNILDRKLVPASALASIARSAQPPRPDLMEAYNKLQVEKVTPKALEGFAPAQRHGPLIIGTLFSLFRGEEKLVLEHCLGS